MTKNKKGFTIIEVVLVLAIAGLIFLMVFIALPALQRSQRNTRRRQDMARILSAFTEYQSNNGGKMPANQDQLINFVVKYGSGVSGCTATKGSSRDVIAGENCGDQFSDPDGTPYTIKIMRDGTTHYQITSTNLDHIIYYDTKSKCSDNQYHRVDADGESQISIRFVLEGGAIYCGDNQ